MEILKLQKIPALLSSISDYQLTNHNYEPGTK